MATGKRVARDDAPPRRYCARMAIASPLDQDGPLLAGVELGGTKAIAVLGRGGRILDSVTIPTRLPGETLAALAEVLAGWRREHRPEALGIASFGPISLDPSDPDRGRMLTTPKPGWIGADILTPLAAAIGTDRVMLHTDVTGAALAEGRWGAGADLRDFVYVTVGTGIGMGIVANRRPIAGRMHPEAGHIRVRRMRDDRFEGVCPFHRDCLEGLASGPAVAARAGAPADTLGRDHPAWVAAADALAEGFAGLFLTLAPAAILVGGGLGLGQPQLLPLIRRGVLAKLAGYLPYLADADAAERAVLPAQLGSRAGPLGTLALAEMAL